MKERKILNVSNLNKLDLSKKIEYPKHNIYFLNYQILKIILFPLQNKYGEKIYLDFFESSYTQQIYLLQNKSYRRYYRDNETFSLKVHKKYLQKINKDPKVQILIIKNEEKFAGFIKIEVKNKKSFVSIAIKKKFQKKNIASKLLKYLIQSNFFIYPHYAEINKKNIPSILAFKKAGFLINKNIKLF